MFTIDNGTLERIFKLAGTTVFSPGDGIFPMDKERIISSLSCKGTKCNERYPSIECLCPLFTLSSLETTHITEAAIYAPRREALPPSDWPARQHDVLSLCVSLG